MAKLATEVMDEMTIDVTVDRVLQQDPGTLKESDYKDFVAAIRAERVHFNLKESKKKDKKEGIEDGED